MGKEYIPEKKTWILWRWRKNGSKTFCKSFVQDIINTTEGKLLELSDYDFGTAYPTRVLLKEIQIV